MAVRLAITTALTVSLMTWVVMPRVTRLVGGWRYPTAARSQRTRQP
jgi:antibiotic biosynthesis monooxygenase (ABM) superfamily enzyme